MQKPQNCSKKIWNWVSWYSYFFHMLKSKKNSKVWGKQGRSIKASIGWCAGSEDWRGIGQRMVCMSIQRAE